MLDDILAANIELKDNQEVIFGVPFPYLTMAEGKVKAKSYHVSAQNCYNQKSGAYTGEVSVEMLKSIGVKHCIIGHSERREYFGESNLMLSEKLDLLLGGGLTPIFCCGEPLSIREAGTQNEYVEKQLEESLFHLSADDLKKIIIAYEPIWAIGTGKTATTEQAQEIHAYLRSVLAKNMDRKLQMKFPFCMAVV